MAAPEGFSEGACFSMDHTPVRDPDLVWHLKRPSETYGSDKCAEVRVHVVDSRAEKSSFNRASPCAEVLRRSGLSSDFIESTHFGFHNFRFACEQNAEVGATVLTYVVLVGTRKGEDDLIRVELSFSEPDTGDTSWPLKLAQAQPGIRKAGLAAFQQVLDSLRPEDAKDATDAASSGEKPTGPVDEATPPVKKKKKAADSDLGPDGNPKLLKLPE
jgi:hypothetical protein